MFYRIVFTIVCLLPTVLHAQLLYQISGNSTEAKSYLLATNKYMDMQFLDSIDNLFKCYSACNKVIGEFSIQDYTALSALRQAAVLPDSVKLSQFYTEKEYEDIDLALQLNVGMGLDKLCRMKPAYLTEMCRAELMKKWLNYDEKRSLETFFFHIAAENGVPVYGLDDVGETMYMQFDREPFHWQCKELQKVIDYPEREVRQERTIQQMYRMGNLQDIIFQVISPDNQTSLSYSDYQVFKARNKVWVKRLAPYLAEGHAFICLDALYVGGDEGLIAELKRAGYRIRAVNRW